ncbi:hypothetical protein CMK11_20320 [Candidatus Poribacteria bacterium]|nr:hypothetical protein [Candidatus Poribacteria bacterium]
MGLLYKVVAVCGGVVVVALAAYSARSLFKRPTDAETIPATPLQIRAWVGLGLGLVVALLTAAVLVARGIDGFAAEPGTRLLVVGIFVGGLGLYGLIVWRLRSEHGEVLLDERDHAVLHRAGAFQAWAVLACLVVWAVALTEAYWDTGAIPVVYPYLILWSCFIVHAVALAAGVLLAYRRAERDG